MARTGASQERVLRRTSPTGIQIPVPHALKQKHSIPRVLSYLQEKLTFPT